MILKTTSEVLRIDLLASADPEMHTFISYVDVNRCNGKETPGCQDGLSNDTTVNTICAAPGADTDRHIKSIIVFNDDNASAEIDIVLYDGTSTYLLFRDASAAGDLIQWTPQHGWQCLKSTGYLAVTSHA